MEFRGAVRAILVGVGWPLAKLVISNDRLEVFAFFRLVSVKKEEVFRIEVTSGVSRSIKVWINPEAHPRFQFWSRKTPQILRALELHGYKIENAPNPSPQPMPLARHG